MKNKLLLALVLFLSVTTASFAQKNASATKPAAPVNPPPRPKAPVSYKADPILQKMIEDLSITPDQQDKIKVILVEREQQCSTGKCTDDQLKDYRKKINSVLTAEQIKKRSEIWKKRTGSATDAGSESAY